MEVNELFRATTPPIVYHRIPDVPIEIVDHRIQLTSNPEFVDPEHLTVRERANLWHTFWDANYTGTLTDNSTLVRTLSLICEEFDNLRVHGIPNELLRLGYFHEQADVPYNRIEYVFRMIKALYGTYLCFLSIVWHDTNAYEKLLCKVILPYNQKKEEPYQISVQNTPEEVCWNYLRHVAKNFNSDSSSIFTAMRVEEMKIIEYRVAYTLAEALLYQLFLHIEAGEKALDGCAYVECARCHDRFVKTHGNRRFCKKCAKNHVRVADHRSREKEKQHAQENHP